jgi:citrate synthase
VEGKRSKAIDINKLRDLPGVITDPRIQNLVWRTSKTFSDGELGILRYRGYAIEDLADVLIL